MDATNVTRRAWLKAATTIGVATMTVKPARSSPQAGDTAASKPLDLGSRREVFVDRLLIDRCGILPQVKDGRERDRLGLLRLPGTAA